MHEILTYQGKLKKTQYNKILETENRKKISNILLKKIFSKIKKEINENNKSKLINILNKII